ncbi:MAG: hypothetical protein JST21_00540, partial [Bacteroidetes bacterium]|nr:hypothetical protein [Bacteroidota bacterium]
SLALMLSILTLSCKKESVENPDLLDRYTGLNSQTMSELKLARDASARYQSIDNALADGYADIAVNTENMGHHYMKTSLVDSIFDLKKPEILVYNKDEEGKPYLVAIEYAVPLNMPKPEGFTGNTDIWDGNTGFQLWLLHAWVWNYNPDGVFHSTNPAIHLHLRTTNFNHNNFPSPL